MSVCVSSVPRTPKYDRDVWPNWRVLPKTLLWRKSAFVSSSSRKRIMRSISSILWMYLGLAQSSSCKLPKPGNSLKQLWSMEFRFVFVLVHWFLALGLDSGYSVASLTSKRWTSFHLPSNFLYGRCISLAFMSSNCIFVFLPANQ